LTRYAQEIEKMARQTKRYLVQIKFGGDVPLRERIAQSAPVLQNHIHQLSRGEFQLAWTSDDGGSFAFLMVCDMPAGFIRGQLQSPGISGRLPREGSALTSGGDSIMVLEIGKDFSCEGFGRAGTWLQRHSA
jgi:hypothetical protein